MMIPPLLQWDGQANTWKKYIEEVFSAFYDDFIKTQPQFHGYWVRCYQQPTYDGKEGGFWHCVTFGETHREPEQNRQPDLRRCERIRWPRFIIEHVDSGDFRIDYWTKVHVTSRGQQTRHYLWLQEEYVVVLEENRRPGKSTIFYLVTAYVTDQKRTMDRFHKERAGQETTEAVPS